MVWCTLCKRRGHWASQCYASNNESPGEDELGDCQRCGRDGHSEDQCFAKKDVDGAAIEDEDDKLWCCDYCGKEFDSEKGANYHKIKWCKKKPQHQPKPTHQPKPQHHSTKTRYQQPSHEKKQPPKSLKVSHADAFRLAMDENSKKTEKTPKKGIYVLKLNDGCMYVGKSDNIDARIEQHRNGSAKCAAWCNRHTRSSALQVEKPRTPPSGDDLNAWEQNETLVQMMVHGFDKVRGWRFTKCDPLEYEDLITIKALIPEAADVCRKCGIKGHFVTSCSASNEKATWLQNIDDTIAKLKVQKLTKRKWNTTAVSDAKKHCSPAQNQQQQNPHHHHHQQQQQHQQPQPYHLVGDWRSNPTQQQHHHQHVNCAASLSGNCTITQRQMGQKEQMKRQPSKLNVTATASTACSTAVFFTEQATTGRSKCQVCRKVIAKGELRRGQRSHDSRFGDVIKFTHLPCSAKAKGAM